MIFGGFNDFALVKCEYPLPLPEEVSSEEMPEWSDFDFETISFSQGSLTDPFEETQSLDTYSIDEEGEIYKNKGVLSGSSITMLQSFKNLIQKVGLSVSDAVKMCCYTPSKVISPKIKINQLEINSYCTFNILDENYNLIK